MNIRDDQWERLSRFLPGANRFPGPRSDNNRQFIEAILWLIHSRKSWVDLPARFGLKNTLYVRFKRWNENGFWRQLAAAVDDDSELATLIAQIVVYGGLCTSKALQRAARKKGFEITKPLPNLKTISFTSESSTEHWLGLVEGRFCNTHEAYKCK
ncbi:transposase [Collimonas pratensis]|uniref:transposase n=1 Tax=Collimonas pratensis TaxID=279113 RepID=UPI000780E05F|nr:transposase [Collimonas pratensis]